MEKIWAWMKEHPYMAIAIVIGIVLLVWLIFGGSSSGTAATQTDNGYASEVAAATQLQEAQIQAQTQSNGINAQLSAQMGQYQAATTIAQIDAQTSQANITAQQTVASQQIAAQQESTDLQTTQNDQVLQNQIAAQKDVALAGFNAEQAIIGNNNATSSSIYSDFFKTQQAIAGGEAVAMALGTGGGSSGNGTNNTGGILNDFNTFGGYGTTNAANLLLESFGQPDINPWQSGIPGAQLPFNTWNGSSFPQTYGFGGSLQPAGASNATGGPTISDSVISHGPPWTQAQLNASTQIPA